MFMQIQQSLPERLPFIGKSNIQTGISAQSIDKETNRSALLYASLAAIAAGSIVTGILLSKGKSLGLDTVINRKGLNIEKGTGLLKNKNGEVYTGVLKYTVNGNKYIRSYENGRLALSGKNIDKNSKPISDSIDYYKIEFYAENDKLRKITSQKRTKGVETYNTKLVLTEQEKIDKLKKDIKVLNDTINSYTEQVKIFLIKRLELISKQEAIKEKFKENVQKLCGNNLNLVLISEQKEAANAMRDEIMKLTIEIEANQADYNTLENKAKLLKKQLKDKQKQFRRLINKKGAV